MTRAPLAPSPPHSPPRKDEYYSEWMMGWELQARWEYGWDHENRLIKVVQW